jgi:4'-phosphopantetheinyl transferase
MDRTRQSTAGIPPAAPQPDGAAPPGPVALRPAEVHLWRVVVSSPAAGDAAAAGALSEDERMRASRFRFEVDRRHFVAAHAALRGVLASYLGAAPASLEFGAGVHGKPFLDGPAHGRSLRFSLSHSGELALVAVCLDREVGADVESVRPRGDLEGFVERYLSPREREALARIPPGDRLRAFFEIWTLKEAYLKACGDGLARELDAFDVTLGDAPSRLVAVRDRSGEEVRWTLQRVEVGEDFAAALAVEGRGWQVRQFDWSV